MRKVLFVKVKINVTSAYNALIFTLHVIYFTKYLDYVYFKVEDNVNYNLCNSQRYH